MEEAQDRVISAAANSRIPDSAILVLPITISLSFVLRGS
jgi:hypothetical protein